MSCALPATVPASRRRDSASMTRAMTRPSSPTCRARGPLNRYLLVFFLSGVPALIYQVVWQRSLSIYFGVDIYSTSVAVAVFLSGLGLGSLVGGHLADRLRRPVISYALVELLIAACGVTSIFALPFIGQRLAGSPVALVILIDGGLLLVPTFLMGLTLPLMSRVVVASDAAIGPHLALLYGLNTLGSAGGALLSAYLIIGHLGLHGATWVAAAINLALAGAISAVGLGQQGRLCAGQRRIGPGVSTDPRPEGAARPSFRSPSCSTSRSPSPRAGIRLGRIELLALSFLSGAIALGYEIAYYRMAVILLHGTVYVFGTVLFVYLCGIATGSLIARRWNDRPGWARRFAWAQVGIAAYTVGFAILFGSFSGLPGLRHLMAASFFTYFHPSLEFVAGDYSVAGLYSLADILLWSALIAFCPALMMGIGFANLLREASDRVSHLGRSVGEVCFANIIGSTVGSLVVGFVALHRFGTERTLQWLALTGLGMALWVLVRAWRHGRASWHQRARRLEATSDLPVIGAAPLGPGWYGVAVAGAVTVLCAGFFPASPALMAAWHLADHPGVELTVMEDRSGTVALRTQREVVAFEQETAILGQTRLHIDGSLHGFMADEAEVDLGVKVALSAHPGSPGVPGRSGRPLRVLSIGLGDGRMVAAAAAAPDVGEVVVVELNQSLRRLLGSTRQGSRIEALGPKVRFVVDDGRRWLSAHPDERFDLVMMWPLHAAHARSGNLFSLEFLRLVQSRTVPGAIIFLRSADPYSTARTVATVFDSVVRIGFQHYIAAMHPLQLNAARAGVPRETLLESLSADRPTILRSTAGSPVNEDFRPRSEYYLTYPEAKWMRGSVAPYAADRATMTGYVADR